MNDKFAIGASLKKLLENLSEKFVAKLAVIEKAFVNTLISEESRTRLLEAEKAKIANFEGGVLEVKSLKVSGEIETDTIKVANGLSSLTDEQMNELKSIITGTEESSDEEVDE